MNLSSKLMGSFDLFSLNFLQFSKPASMVIIGICSFLVYFSLLNLVRRVLAPSRMVKNGKTEPPEVENGWPIIGHLHHFMGKNNKLIHEIFGDMADKYGPTFTLRMGLTKVLVVSSAEVAKECLTTNDLVFIGRPPRVANSLLGYSFAMFPFSPYGTYYSQMRKIVTHELLSTSRVESLKHVWNSEINKAIQELHHKVVSVGGGSPVLIEFKRWFSDLTLRTTVKLICGKQYFGTDGATQASMTINGGGDDDEAGKFQEALREFFCLLGKFRVSDVIPFLGWLDFGTGYKEKKNRMFIDSLMEEWLEEHKMKRRLLNEADKKESRIEQDFMDVMISKLDDPNLLSHYDADTINKATCLTLILGGSDTTMVSLVWALTLLMNHPHVLKKVQDELDFHVGRERQVEESDMKNLVYLHAVMKEAMRLNPAGTLSAPRMSTKDCTVSGYHIPAGTHLFMNTWKIQRDPNAWVEPTEFRPERFLTTHKDFDLRGQNFELLPFGSGRRSCLGANFAPQVLRQTLARLLHGFDLKTPSDEPVDMTGSAGLINMKATPLEVLVTPRLFSSELYG
uniref:Dihydrobenzophenanthridine alkaloid 10-hydroxylase n=1 Tax=Eschscholzia californica subsp. californica TaxID=222997 RepID=A0A2Z6BXV9_ESCCA|nr:dihydrobenzophenanthridine alkaloid 10-hydroxylase [Eschscholzia californica subsp. californica]